MTKPNDIDTPLDQDLSRLEEHLAQLSPAKMPDQLLLRMEMAMVTWQIVTPADDNAKIIPFERPNVPLQQSHSPKLGSAIHIWGTAAAVALIAAIGSIIHSSGKSPASTTPVTANTPPKASKTSSLLPIPAHTPSSSSLYAKHFSNNITNASNEGITYAGDNNTPYKVLKIKYMKEVRTVDKNGQQITSLVPAEETILIPIEIQ